MRAQLGTVEKSWRAVETAAKDAWDGIKNVGRPTSLSDDVAHFNQLADTYKQNLMAGFHQTDAQAEQNPVVQANRAKALALQPGADLEKWAADNDAANAKIQQAAIKGSDVMDQYLKAAKADSAKAEEIKKVKDATAALLAADPANKTKYLADQTTALAQIDKKYTNHDAKSADSADEASQVAAFKASLAATTDAYKNSQAELEAARKAGTLSEQDYYKQSNDLLWQNEADQVTAIQAEITRLQQRKAIGAERIKLDSQINTLEADASKIEADAMSKSDQLADQQQAAYQKRQQAVDAYAAALDKSNDALQAQMDAEVAHIGMGDREFQQQQKVNQALTEQASKLEDLALKRQAGQRGESGGLTQEQYDADVAALQAATDRKVNIITVGYQRQNAAREDWENGLARGYANWADEATNVAGEVASATTNVFDGFANATVQALNGGKNAWHDFAVSVIEDIEKIAIKLAEQQAVAAILSAFGYGIGAGSGAGDALNGGSNYTGSGSLSTSWAGEGDGWSFNAKGGVYDSPSLSAYSGGIYDSPHLFKFATGAGVFGEAGPEAIMPLKRGADGRLGIASSGGSGDIYFTQTISIASDGMSAVDQNTNNDAMRSFGNTMRTVAQSEISRALQPGGQIWRARNGSGGRG
jgi:lambda family phage tail tape measure protein